METQNFAAEEYRHQSSGPNEDSIHLQLLALRRSKAFGLERHYYRQWIVSLPSCFLRFTRSTNAL
jgi:hypothetical protein